MRRGRQVVEAGSDYEEAVQVARIQGARMLELHALTDWLGLPGAPDQVRADLEACVADMADMADSGPSRSLTEARRALEAT